MMWQKKPKFSNRRETETYTNIWDTETYTNIRETETYTIIPIVGKQTFRLRVNRETHIIKGER